MTLMEATTYHCSQCRYDWELHGTRMLREGQLVPFPIIAVCPSCQNEQPEKVSAVWHECIED